MVDVTKTAPPTGEPPQPDRDSETRRQVRRVLEEEVARVDSPEAAEAVVERVERLAAGATEAQRAERAAAAPAPAAAEIQATRQRAADRTDEAAAVLAQAAAESVAPVPEAPAVLAAAQEVLGPPAVRQQVEAAAGKPAVAPPEVRSGRRLLRDAMLRRLGPLQKLDARLYLLINGVPHPRWSDRMANAVTIWATGGWIWAGAVLVARWLGLRYRGHVLTVLFPSMIGATWIVEVPVKAFFRRRRPFIDVVRALVVGKRPGSWSFPSGHTASSFACAWVLSTYWPRRAPLFFTLASIVGLSRIYVGAHYPGDVISGAISGTVIAEGIRRVTCRLLRSR